MFVNYYIILNNWYGFNKDKIQGIIFKLITLFIIIIFGTLLPIITTT